MQVLYIRSTPYIVESLTKRLICVTISLNNLLKGNHNIYITNNSSLNVCKTLFIFFDISTKILSRTFYNRHL